MGSGVGGRLETDERTRGKNERTHSRYFNAVLRAAANIFHSSLSEHQEQAERNWVTADECLCAGIMVSSKGERRMEKRRNLKV